MNDQKLQRLFGAARNEPPPAPSDDFHARVVRAIRRAMDGAEPNSVFDQLGRLFPRLALAAALVIGLCVLVDVCLASFGQRDLADSVAEISEQWLFASN